jgi:hypothetical protein
VAQSLRNALIAGFLTPGGGNFVVFAAAAVAVDFLFADGAPSAAFAFE